MPARLTEISAIRAALVPGRQREGTGQTLLGGTRKTA
jgi:hypothetical protein